ncbi:PIF-6 [Buzura suppressaria nucleopolyhedrovirus]|uniref:PIF-6 n=1 Tax=Buzura suppressaria nuclear polyhedrosis virus TaxID=74320 RepID=W5VL37_NPVBS|nr:PIF-6 [Buzura suppressaria nucleopolyhedrovirus]AHH82644.1 PIF-6 [Buzura suppressaria nucleopolyhedrovirus]AKN91027.1 PIF-6 [Buzura suppressaria nucleopolyhedrovirus]QYF10618.1 per os infectivity factor 6 [Buzura suppressaria nucleopolyhedrovirus]
MRWRMLNSNRVEVVPEDRKDAWQQLVIKILKACPRYGTFRTNINKANFENFDYKRPLVYDVGERTLFVNSEFLNKALNRPRSTVTAFNIRSYQIALAFICAILIIVITAFAFDDRSYKQFDN